METDDRAGEEAEDGSAIRTEVAAVKGSMGRQAKAYDIRAICRARPCSRSRTASLATIHKKAKEAAKDDKDRGCQAADRERV